MTVFATNQPHSVEVALLKESVEYRKWRTGETNRVITSTGKCTYNKDWVPVGTIPFVENSLKHHYNVEVEPIQIPKALMKPEYLLRQAWYVDSTGNQRVPSDCFVKDISAYKAGTLYGMGVLPEGKYFLSEKVSILSEYRVFVFNSEVRGVKHYSGDAWVLPDKATVLAMVQAFEGAPIAYTLDVAVTPYGTAVVEVHHFYSCGLYGFDDPDLYNMFSRAYKELARYGSKSYR